MIHYKLLSWQGTYPRNTGKGVVVLSGQNLIRISVPDKHRLHVENIDKRNEKIWHEKIDILEIAKNKLLNHLQTIKHKDFKFMSVVDLTI